MAKIRSFRELDVYCLALREAGRIFAISQRFPREEIYSLTDQIRRCSRAVGAMIAEAWARRRYPGVFVSKLNEALGECTEVQAWLDHALACGYLTPEQHQEMNEAWQQIGGMLSRMCARATEFCKPSPDSRAP